MQAAGCDECQAEFGKLRTEEKGKEMSYRQYTAVPRGKDDDGNDKSQDELILVKVSYSLIVVLFDCCSSVRAPGSNLWSCSEILLKHTFDTTFGMGGGTGNGGSLKIS